MNELLKILNYMVYTRPYRVKIIKGNCTEAHISIPKKEFKVKDIILEALRIFIIILCIIALICLGILFIELCNSL